MNKKCKKKEDPVWKFTVPQLQVALRKKDVDVRDLRKPALVELYKTHILKIAQ